MDEQVYTQLTVTADTAHLETLTAVMSMIDTSLLITDYSDAETLSGVYGNLIDESILDADKTRASVSVFLTPDKSIAEHKAFLTERFSALQIPVSITVDTMREEDWAENWKQYYHPMHFGRVTVVPAWEEYTPQDGEVTLLMDPGMAFGTGTHETTRLALFFLEREMKSGARVLDVGTGSGILSIAAARLGASYCLATDLDPDAVKNARENVEKNGCDSIECRVSDLLSAVEVGDTYDFVLANIVADILLLLIPEVSRVMKPHATFVLSGIIASRTTEVTEALRLYGFTVNETATENDWNAILATKAD